ncbi:MAG: family 20 glycosylhydrolase [Phycisphaeraceae bacterium]
MKSPSMIGGAGIRMMTAALVLLAGMGTCWAQNQTPRADRHGLALIPWPKSVQVAPGELVLGQRTRIVATQAQLKPLADILAGEIHLITGLRLSTAQGAGAPGDIVLAIDPQLRADRDILTVRDQKVTSARDYAHTLVVNDRAVVTGFDYRAVAEGTATLLQALRSADGKTSLPRLTVKDWPEADFMAIMVDVGRQDIPITALKQSVEACRYYKVRYCQLHLSDDQGWTFPSTAYPKLGSRNTAAHGGIPPRVYDLQELKELVAFADARGVTLVPEMETPGHSGAARLALPDLLDDPDEPGGEAHLALMNIANDELYPVLGTLVAEISAVFKSSPYFHIGCDETNFSVLAQRPKTKAYLEQHGIKGIHELFVQHIQRMDKIVRKHGKMTIVWEGAALDADTMRDTVIVMPWVGDNRTATRLQKEGFTTITVPWNMGVPWPQWSMYHCNLSVLSRQDKVIGAMLPMWEMSADALVNQYLKGIPNRQERTWGPDNAFVEDELNQRIAVTGARLSRLIHPVTMEVEGLVKLDPQRGVELGGTAFNKEAAIRFAGPLPDAVIHYTVDGSEPTAASPQYREPITLTKDATVQAALFDSAGRALAFPSRQTYRRVDFEENLTTGKPVTISGGTQDDVHKAELAVDGLVARDSSWWAAPGPQWLSIDLEKAHSLDKVAVYTYWDGRRYYQYNVELSADGKAWTQVADMSRNTAASSEQGDWHAFAPMSARYVRVNLLKGSAHPDHNPVHLVEVRVYEAK